MYHCIHIVNSDSPTHTAEKRFRAVPAIQDPNPMDSMLQCTERGDTAYANLVQVVPGTVPVSIFHISCAQASSSRIPDKLIILQYQAVAVADKRWIQ